MLVQSVGQCLGYMWVNAVATCRSMLWLHVGQCCGYMWVSAGAKCGSVLWLHVGQLWNYMWFNFRATCWVYMWANAGAMCESVLRLYKDRYHTQIDRQTDWQTHIQTDNTHRVRQTPHTPILTALHWHTALHLQKSTPLAE